MTSKEKRAESVRQARANVRLEGLEISEKAAEDGRRYVAGKVSAEQLTADARKRYGLD